MSSPCTQLFQKRVKIVRQFAGNGHRLSCARMHEAKLLRVQALAVLPQLGLFMAVDGVAQNRVAAIGHVDADLVRPARFQLTLDERIAGKALQHAPVRHGAAAVFLRDGHFLAVRRMATDGRVNGAGIVPDIAADDAHIRPGQAVILQLRGKRGVREVILGRNDQPGRVLVNAVDDAGALFPADAGQRIAATGQQRVAERPVGVAGAGWTTSPLGLLTTITSASS